ncbi:MAG: hypothetical protein E7097_07725 [Bacteroides sp.]|nr:hypothetical protein [Bacteroides sp.]
MIFCLFLCCFIKKRYLCTVFFIVLDLRLTKVGAKRCSFFYVYTFVLWKLFIFLSYLTEKV